MTNPTLYFISMPAEKVLLLDAGVDRRDIIECWGDYQSVTNATLGRRFDRIIVSMEIPGHRDMWSAVYDSVAPNAALYNITIELMNIYYLAQNMRKAAKASVQADDLLKIQARRIKEEM